MTQDEAWVGRDGVLCMPHELGPSHGWVMARRVHARPTDARADGEGLAKILVSSPSPRSEGLVHFVGGKDLCDFGSPVGLMR